MVLKNYLNLSPVLAVASPREPPDVLPVEGDITPGKRVELEYGSTDGAFATPTLSHQAEGLPRRNIQVHSVYCLDLLNTTTGNPLEEPRPAIVLGDLNHGKERLTSGCGAASLHHLMRLAFFDTEGGQLQLVPEEAGRTVVVRDLEEVYLGRAALVLPVAASGMEDAP